MKLLAALLTSVLLMSSTALAADAPEEMGFGETSRRSLKVQNDPCYKEHGAQRIVCVTELKKATVFQRNLSGGGRLQRFMEGKIERRSILIPKWMTDPKRIDLRSSSEKMQEMLQNRKITTGEKEPVPVKEAEIPALRIRTKAATRADNPAIPVCTRRHGLMLVVCLKEMGIEINAQTVDPLTLELYRQSEMPTQQ